MASWLQDGLVSGFDENGVVKSGRGKLASVWLGGLTNPQFFMTALKQTKAAEAGCAINEVCKFK